MSYLSRLFSKWLGRKRDIKSMYEMGEEKPAEWVDYMHRRNSAIDTLESHGLTAYYYHPAIKIADNALADACRFLASTGYIITDAEGKFVGKIAVARPKEGKLSVSKKPSFSIHQ